jgi:hypothetical protein
MAKGPVRISGRKERRGKKAQEGMEEMLQAQPEA